MLVFMDTTIPAKKISHSSVQREMLHFGKSALPMLFEEG
jgi:hypothetical protein